MRNLLQDLRYGARLIVRQPGHSAIVALTLALAIGANTVIFSFTNILLIRPLPVEDPGTLTWIFTLDPQQGGDRGRTSIADLLDYRASLRSFESIAATTTGSYTLTGRGDAASVSASLVTSNIFETWGLKMAAGSPFAEGDDAPGAAGVVVLSHKYWQREFGGDPSVVGQALTLNGRPHTVVGVVAPEIEIGNLSLIDVWVPIVLDPALPRDRRDLRVSARLRPDVPIEQANAEVRAVSQRLEQEHPKTNTGWIARVAPSQEAMTGSDTWLVLGLLTLVVGFVLLIACANIANLVLARATARRRELAVRTALGASRARMVRQLLTESILLGVMGGLLGLGVAHAGLAVIKAAAYEPFFALVVIDRTVLLFTAALALVTPLVFSLLPALHASRTDLNETLKDSGARAGGGVRGRRSRAVLVVSQLSLAMTLLIVSGLLVRTMIALNQAPLGFDPAGLLTVRLDLPDWRYGSDASVVDYYDRLLARLGALPGVQQATAVDRMPVLGSEATIRLTVDGYVPPREEDRPWAVPVKVADGFFAATGLPILTGRAPELRDGPGSLRVAVVNAEMARRYWGGADRALGGRVVLAHGDGGWIQVIGVSGDVMRGDLRGVNPQIYLPARQHPERALVVMVKAARPETLVASVRGEVRTLDVDVPIQQLRTLQEAFDDELSSSRILTGMFVAFAVVALALAAGGLHGVIAYSVSQRTQEIGIRMALGAVPADIRRLIVRQTVALVLVGSALGLAGGAAVARLSATLLYDVSASDPATYIGVAVLLPFIAAVSAWAPMRRAIRVDPLLALRTE